MFFSPEVQRQSLQMRGPREVFHAPFDSSEASGGKRQIREAIAPGDHHSHIRVISAAPPGTLSVWDELSLKAFLVDTGADISVFPAVDRSTPDRRGLLAANGSIIRTYGTSLVELQFSGFRVQHPFRLADVSKPILGSDFFLRHDLVIDLRRQRLLRMPPAVNANVVIKARLARVSSALCGLQTRTAPDGFEGVFEKFPEVLDSKYCLLYTSPSPRDLSTSRMPSSA